MASGDLVNRPTLDSSGIEQGAQKAAKALGNLKKYSELAEKGLKSLGNADGLKGVKEKFNDLGRQIEKFSTKMNNGLNVKAQSKQIQMQLTEVATAYRSLSKEEQSSAEGKWLKQYMNELTVMGGKAKDTIGDMQAQISAMASDTPILAGMAQATSLVADGFTIAKGAASAFGVSEENLAKLQKELTSLMAISNAAMNIKNALTNQGAIQTAILSVKIKANILLTELQAAATGKAGLAAKGAAVAQAIWNKTVMAHPFIAVTAAVTALALAIYNLTRKTSEQEKEEEKAIERHQQLGEVLREGVNHATNSIAKIVEYTMKVNHFNGSAAEEARLVEQCNKQFGDSLGKHQKLSEWKTVLVKNGAALAHVMILEAQAQGLLSKYTEHYIHVLEAKKMMEALHVTPEQAEKSGGLLGALGSAYKDNKAAADMYLAETKQVMGQIDAISKQYNLNLPTPQVPTTTPTKKGTNKNATNNDKKALENSLAWFDEEINKRKEYQLKFAIDHKDWQRVQDEIEDFERRKILKQIELEYGGFREALGSVSKGFENAAITGLKSPEISKVLTGITLPNWEEINADAAEKKMNAILKKTEGLRMVANAAGEAFGSLGQAIGDNTAGKVVDFAGMIASSIAIMVEGYARATAAAGKLSPWAWLAFGLTGAAQLGAMIAQVKSFNTGGIVGGNGSFSAYNDGIVMRASQGEMMLNKQQQRKLFDSINGGLDRTHNGNVTFTIKGRELVGVLNNYNETFSRTR